MKYIIFLLCVFFYCKSDAQPCNRDTIIWRASYRLKADDFTGTPILDSKFGAITRAGICCNSTYGTDTSLYFTVTCIFYKNISWINPSELDSNLIEHEQGHFDIAEIFSRKLEQRLCSLETYNYKKEKEVVNASIQTFINQITVERNLFDEAYDRACASPPSPTQQKVWTRKIQELLKINEKK